MPAFVTLAIDDSNQFQLQSNLTDADAIVDVLVEGLRLVRTKQKAERDAAKGPTIVLAKSAPPVLPPNPNGRPHLRG